MHLLYSSSTNFYIFRIRDEHRIARYVCKDDGSTTGDDESFSNVQLPDTTNKNRNSRSNQDNKESGSKKSKRKQGNPKSAPKKKNPKPNGAANNGEDPLKGLTIAQIAAIKEKENQNFPDCTAKETRITKGDIAGSLGNLVEFWRCGCRGCGPRRKNLLSSLHPNALRSSGNKCSMPVSPPGQNLLHRQMAARYECHCIECLWDYSKWFNNMFDEVAFTKRFAPDETKEQKERRRDSRSPSFENNSVNANIDLDSYSVSGLLFLFRFTYIYKRLCYIDLLSYRVFDFNNFVILIKSYNDLRLFMTSPIVSHEIIISWLQWADFLTLNLKYFIEKSDMYPSFSESQLTLFKESNDRLKGNTNAIVSPTIEEEEGNQPSVYKKYGKEHRLCPLLWV